MNDDRIDTLTDTLGALSKALAHAYDELHEAESEWDELADQVALVLAEEAAERGSKQVPPEHAVVTATRREHRSAYQRLRRAKREVAKLTEISQNRRAELSGAQTQKREGADRQPAATGFQRPRAV